MKKLMLLLVIIFLALWLPMSALAADKPGTKYHWRWAHYQPIDSIVDKVSKDVVQEIAQKSEGRIKIDIYPASQLGDWMEVSEQIMRGSVEIGLLPVSPVYDPRIQVRVLPYSVMNWKEAETAFLSKNPYLLNIMEELMAGVDLKALAVVAQGFGGGGFSSVPTVDLLDPASDKKGIKMRFPPGNQAWEAMVKAMGFLPTPVPWGELYMGLQTKLVDAQVGGQAYNTWSSFRDVTKCWVQYNTHFQNSFIYMNFNLWKKLTPADQQIIKKACMNQSKASFVQARNEDEKYIEMMKAAGINVIIPTDEQLGNISKIIRSKVWPVMDPIIGKKIMDEVRKNSGI
ncbi:MAG: TRAP transporter substrate-binding protein DctP [Syntrophaceae bacterium]|nr:TRAP transporter substrate-binding protein DctP [Syntrophaceae bacterium]